MAPSTKALRPRPPAQAGPWPASPWAAPPATGAECLRRIEALGERVAGHVRFMGRVGSLGGSSGETKEKAVTAFYESLALMEDQLARIREGLAVG